MSKKTFYGNTLMTVDEATTLKPRDPFDFYPTPWSVIEEALWHQYSKGVYSDSQRISILDIGAGSGRWGQVARSIYPNAYIQGIEAQPIPQRPEAYDSWITGDVMEWLPNLGEKYDLIVGNPPFYLFGKKYVQALFDELHKRLRYLDSRMVLFSRSALAESQVRYDAIFRNWKPIVEATCVNRVSFYPEGHPRCGAVNATAHSIYIWAKGSQSIARKEWLPGLVNDDKYEGPFKGQNTWQDMIELGLVKEETK